MVRNCCVKLCHNHWVPNTNISFFSFPIKNESVANQWRQVPCTSTLGKSSTICSDHFIESDFTYHGPKRGLKKHAVPSIYPDPEELHVLQEELQRKAQAATLGVGQGQAFAPPVYERRCNAAPDVLQLQSEGGESRQDTLGPESGLHSVETEVRQQELQAQTVRLGQQQTYSREYERHHNATPDAIFQCNEDMNNQSEEESSSDTFNYSSSDEARKIEHKVQSTKVGMLRNSKPKPFDLRYPGKIQKILINAEEHVKQLQAKIRSTQQRNRRLEGQVLRLKNLVKHLKSVHR